MPGAVQVNSRSTPTQHSHTKLFELFDFFQYFLYDMAINLMMTTLRSL